MYAEHEAARAKARDALKREVIDEIEETIFAGGKAADGYLIALRVTDFERDAVGAMLDGVRGEYAERFADPAVPA